MSQAEEITHVETAIKFTRWFSSRTWKDYLILLDVELGIHFGWPQLKDCTQ